MPPQMASSGGKTRPPHPAVGGKGLRLPNSSSTRGTATRRHRKIVKDTIRGITKGDIRRMARRGGVKRISAVIYDDARDAIQNFLKGVLHDCVAILDSATIGRRTVTVSDVIFALKRRGRPIYGFDKETYNVKKRFPTH